MDAERPSTSSKSVEAITLKMPTARDIEGAFAKSKPLWQGLFFCVFVPGALLLVILLPLSFKTVEYYQYGLLRRGSTGKMRLDKGVYDTGRYFVGPDYNFKYFQADAHVASFRNLSVFSSDRLECAIDLDVVYYINKTELVKLHNTYERQYKPVVESRVQDAIKNTAPKYATVMFFTQRQVVQDALFAAIKERIREVFCEAEYVYLMLVTIPDEVAARQLKSAVQLENNIREEYLSNGTQIRQETTKLVNAINNNATLIEQKASADANIITSRATTKAGHITLEAQQTGLAYMFSKLNITTAEHKSSLDYIRMLQKNPYTKIDVGYSTKISTFTSG